MPGPPRPASLAAARACAGDGPRPRPGRSPSRRATRSADSTSIRHHHGSARKPSPMPSTRARTVVCRTKSVIPCRSASSRKPLRGSAVNCARRRRPARRREQPGAQAEVLEHSVSGHQPQVGLVGGQRRELAAPFLGRGLVIAVQQDCVTGGAPAGQPLDGVRVTVEPIATLQPRGHQQRHRHRPDVHLCAELVDIVQCAFTDPGDRDDQLPRHTTILTMSDVQMVTYTRTTNVDQALRPANSAAQPRSQRLSPAHRAPSGDEID